MEKIEVTKLLAVELHPGNYLSIYLSIFLSIYLMLIFLSTCRRYMAEILPIRLKHYPINQFI